MNDNHQSCSSDSFELSSGSTSPATNGFENKLDAKTSHSVYSNNNENEDGENRTERHKSRNEESAEEGDKTVKKKGLAHVDEVSKPSLWEETE